MTGSTGEREDDRKVFVDRTFLFTDLVGSTERWERERERIAVLLSEHDDLLTRLIAQHSGEVLKRTGDGVVATFHEPREAVECAIAMQRALPSIGTENDEPLSVRMGLHAGVVESRLGDLFGSPINRAARIMSVAHGGQILVSELVRDGSPLPGVDYVSVGTHRLKGLARPEMLFQVVADGLDADFPPVGSLNATLGNLPAVPDVLMFRDDELVAAAQGLDTMPVTTLVGPGGVGKTRLAVHLARTVAGQFPDGCWFVDLAVVRTPGLVASTVASLLGVLQRSGLDLTGTLRETLTARELLLVLDNCEHLHDEVVDFVQQLTSAAMRGKVLCTSQRSLGLATERAIRLEPLPVGEAVGFFRDKARLVAPGFELNDANRAAVEHLCAALDGLPLALELAAARCAVLDPEAIADRLDQRFRLLRSHAPNERHRTLEAAITWSFELLSDDQRDLLEALSIFVGSFDLRAATVASGGDEFDVLDTIAVLVDRSVLTVRDGRYRLLDSVRALAAQRLAERPDAATVAAGHAAWFREWCGRARDGMLTDDAPRWLDAVATDLNDVRAALTWWVAHEPATAATMVIDLADYWLTRSQTQEGVRWLGDALAAMDDRDPAITSVQSWMGGFCWAHGDIDGAQRWSATAVESAEHHGQPFPAIAGTRLAVVAAFAVDLDAARRWADLTAEAIIADPAQGLYASSPLGVAYGLVGDTEKWQQWCADGVARGRRNGPARLSTALTNQLFMQNMRDEAEVLPVALECAETAALVGSKVAEGNAYIAIARIQLAKGERVAAMDAYRRGLPALLTSGAQPLVIGTLEDVAATIGAAVPGDAAALWSATEGLRDCIGEKGSRLQRSERERRTTELRDTLGDDGFSRACARGFGLTLDQTVELALIGLDRALGE